MKKRQILALLVMLVGLGFAGALYGSALLLTLSATGMFSIVMLLLARMSRFLRISEKRRLSFEQRSIEEMAGCPDREQRELDLATLQTLREALTDARHVRNELMSRADEFETTKAEAAAVKTKLHLYRAESAASLRNLKEEHKRVLESTQAQHKTALKETHSRALEEGADRLTKSLVTKSAGLGQASTQVITPYGLGPYFFYGSQHHKDVRVLEQIAMKTGSLKAREAIALSATNLQHSLATLLIFARSIENGITDSKYYALAKGWNSRSLNSLARVMADQAAKPSDYADAVALYKLVINAQGAWRLDKRARLILLETLQTLGRRDEMIQMISDLKVHEELPIQTALLLSNDIVTAVGTHDKNVPEEWFEKVNSIYRDADLAPIAAEGLGGDLLSRLYASANLIETGPLVTVMMPTHNGSAWIRTAVNSVLSQTWRNLELIIVDDCSTEAYWEELGLIADSDKRIRLFRLPSNQGAYRARNLAFTEARGEFVTVHDDDDWSHPQKIEVQVRHLMTNPDVVGNMSMQTRIDQNNMFVRINDNPEFVQRNYSSMMMKKSTVQELGGWDDINRAADAEFHDRIYAVTGKRVIGVGSAPLSFMRARSGSLTSGEIRRGALDFARQTFGLSYSAWHEQIRTQNAPEVFDTSNRPYLVPENMKSGMRNTTLGPFDVVYITDYRFPGGNSSLIAAEIDAAANLGLRVAVAHLDSPVLRSRRPMSAKVHEVLREHSIPIITISDAVEAGLVVVRNPSVLQFTDRLQTGIKAASLALIVNTAPMGKNGDNACFDLEECVIHAQKMFGMSPDIYPESLQTRSLVEGLYPGLPYAESEWPGFIDDTAFHQGRNVETRRLPVVGRHSRDHSLKWPENAADIARAYVRPEIFETKILGGAGSISDRYDLAAQPTVTVYPFGLVEPADFLKEIDFWVYFHDKSLVESFGMSIVEAMASGAVVILPEYMKPMFGSAALYGSPSDVGDIVTEYWSDKALFREQSERGVSAVRKYYSRSSYQSRLKERLNIANAVSTTEYIGSSGR